MEMFYIHMVQFSGPQAHVVNKHLKCVHETLGYEELVSAHPQPLGPNHYRVGKVYFHFPGAANAQDAQGLLEVEQS